MRLFSSFALVASAVLAPSLAFAQEHAAEGPVDLLAPKSGLMVWTLVVFIVLMFILSRYAFKPLFALVEAREKALEEAVDGAKRNHAESEKFLAQQRDALEAAKVEAQKIIADSRATAEKVRADLLEQTKVQQAEMLNTARRSIAAEQHDAQAELRLQAIDLAIKGAGRVVEQNLDSEANRKIVERFLASIETPAASK